VVSSAISCPSAAIFSVTAVCCSPGSAAMKTMSDKRATAELLVALVEVAITHGCRHYSKSGEPLATALAVLECLQREGFVAVEEPATP